MDIYTLQLVILILFLLASPVKAHELTPTYPELKPSFVEGVYVAKMKMWNRREDAEYYEINVYDEEWNAVPFAAVDKIFQISYLQHLDFEVYIRESDKDKVEFICTTSKQLKEDVESTGIKSMICSRVK
jgi:hypothetical protein